MKDYTVGLEIRHKQVVQQDGKGKYITKLGV